LHANDCSWTDFVVGLIIDFITAIGVSVCFALALLMKDLSGVSSLITCTVMSQSKVTDLSLSSFRALQS
jgi:hypothetical protein